MADEIPQNEKESEPMRAIDFDPRALFDDMMKKAAESDARVPQADLEGMDDLDAQAQQAESIVRAIDDALAAGETGRDYFPDLWN